MQADVEMCAKLAHEGIGSLYERVVLREFLHKLVEEKRIASVLEYDCRVTKGYDNIPLMAHADTTVAVASPPEVEQTWPFASRPQIVGMEENGSYDLVWSFAVAQVEPESVERMRSRSARWVLVFVPNALNWGSPFHRMLHVLTRTPCHHAEHRQHFALGMAGGVSRLLASAGVTPERWGYIDKPWLPDIGFSKRELRKLLGRGAPEAGSSPSPEQLAASVQSLFNFESWRMPRALQALVAHHLYVLGSVTD
jgi:hypothetical protein